MPESMTVAVLASLGPDGLIQQKTFRAVLRRLTGGEATTQYGGAHFLVYGLSGVPVLVIGDVPAAFRPWTPPPIGAPVPEHDVLITDVPPRKWIPTGKAIRVFVDGSLKGPYGGWGVVVRVNGQAPQLHYGAAPPELRKSTQVEVYALARGVELGLAAVQDNQEVVAYTDCRAALGFRRPDGTWRLTRDTVAVGDIQRGLHEAVAAGRVRVVQVNRGVVHEAHLLADQGTGEAKRLLRTAV